jgi:hypothetical protein
MKNRFLNALLSDLTANDSCRRTLSLDAVRLVFLFFTSAEWLSGRVKEPFQPLFLCSNSKPYGMRVMLLGTSFL